jgi:hypothetical protein
MRLEVEQALSGHTFHIHLLCLEFVFRSLLTVQEMKNMRSASLVYVKRKCNPPPPPQPPSRIILVFLHLTFRWLPVLVSLTPGLLRCIPGWWLATHQPISIVHSAFSYGPEDVHNLSNSSLLWQVLKSFLNTTGIF